MAIDFKSTDMNQVIGIRGEREPRLCAVSGRALSRPWVTHSLGGAFFCRVLARFDNAWTPEYQDRMEAVLKAEPKPIGERPAHNRLPKEDKS